MSRPQRNDRIIAVLVAATVAAAMGAACTTIPQQPPPRVVVDTGPEFLAPLEGQPWRLVSVAGRPVPAGGQEPYLYFDKETGRISGSTGCNRLIGGYRVSGDRITIDQAGATMMACVDGAEAERPFLDAIERTARWRVRGRELTLYDASGASLAQFVAQAPRPAAPGGRP